ncbi:MAG: DNA polymerase III subunit alpha [Rickettsiales bacterium]|jgi:DNA polymerase-3 subunit alpha|nr:DNA polymerase III subunit alpha [Rickettsiales bacterium]
MSDFVHLNLHTGYSVGIGTITVQRLAELCAENKMPAVAITDTNLMTGIAEASDKLPASGIQPIIGITISVNHHNADPKMLRADSLARVILLAQNHGGYLNLCRLSEIMYMRDANLHLGAHITIDELFSHADGLICLSGNILINEILQGLDAAPTARKFYSAFGDRFYIELQRHGLDAEIKSEPGLLRIARELNIPIVATNNACFAAPENYESSDAYGCILDQTKIIDPDRRRRSSEQYFKSAAEMRELFSDLAEACDNTVSIARRCNFFVNVHEKPLLPKFAADFDEECRMLRDGTMSGLTKLVADMPEDARKPYFDQAEFELQTIINMGFPGYFLIVAEYIEWCRENDIMTGPGRGSGAGSVVAWSLGITKVDPLKYGLLFERFLNPDRISMPDFDIDFEPVGLERVKQHLIEKYGNEEVCQIITFGSLQAKGAVRDCGRVFGVPYSKSDKLCKIIPNDAKTLRDAINGNYEIQDILNDDDIMKKSVSVAMDIEGAIRALGQHACGIVIGDRPTIQISPVYRDAANPLPSCQFDMDYLEKAGLIKFDFLGLETLAILKRAAAMIEKNHLKKIDLENIPLDDELTFKNIYQPGKTDGIFQFEAQFVKQTLKKMRPTKFEHLVALTALNRPGPIGFIPSYIARMHGEEPVQYPHDKAKDILEETFGIFVYQEQIMLLTRALAGFTRGEADGVRKAMGKKIIKMMNEFEVKWLAGCERENTLAPDAAKKMWEEFKEFAKYAFNKSHSVCYGIISQQCAYLKAHWPAEFLAASISSSLNDAEKISAFMEDARANFGIVVVPPDINKSEALFHVADGKIIYGLAGIKGVGTAAANQIVAERIRGGAFKDLTDFAKRTAGMINKRVVESFAKTGVLDCLEPSRARVFMNADAILMYASRQRADAGVLSLFGDEGGGEKIKLQPVPEWSFGERLENELSALGFYISAHPLDQYKNLLERSGMVNSITLQKTPDRKQVSIAANVNSYQRRRTKAGKEMLSVNASDIFGNIDAVAFGDSAIEFANILARESVVIINGRASARDDTVSIFIDGISPISAWVSGAVKKLTLNISDTEVLPGLKGLIDSLPNGNTRIVLRIGENSLAIPRSVRLNETIVSDMSQLGIKIEME